MRPPTVKSKSLERGKQFSVQERTLKTMGSKNDDAQRPTINLRITAFTSQGGRDYMEDQIGLSYVPCPDDIERASYFYAGVYDGHGGEEASKYAKQHLMEHIVLQKEFWLNDDEKTLEAIKLGFMSLQRSMMHLYQREVWCPTHKGYKSTSGSTASIVIFRDGKLYIGHVGDSRVVVGQQKPDCPSLSSPWMSMQLTKDHKPEDPEEEARIIGAGGKVVEARGVHRVVWTRQKAPNMMDSPDEIEEVPFLAVARSLGDFWSYNSENDRFIVSPEPDVEMLALNANEHRCVILASDGIWGMMDSRESVLYVQKAEILRARSLTEPEGHVLPKSGRNPSSLIGREALKRWAGRKARADNISVITIILEDPRESEPSYIPVSYDPVGQAEDPIENIPLGNENLHSSDVSSSDGDSVVTTDSIEAVPTSLELQEPDVTSSSNEVRKTPRKAPRTPSPDITAPIWSLEIRRSSAFQRYRRRTPGSGQGCSPTVMKIGENGQTVSTPQRRRQTPKKMGTSPLVRRRILSSFTDVADQLKDNLELKKMPEQLVQAGKRRRTPQKSPGSGHAQKKRRIQSMPMLKRKSPRRSTGPYAAKKRKSPRCSTAVPNAVVESPVSLDLEFITANPFCRVTRSQIKKNKQISHFSSKK